MPSPPIHDGEFSETDSSGDDESSMLEVQLRIS